VLVSVVLLRVVVLVSVVLVSVVVLVPVVLLSVVVLDSVVLLSVVEDDSVLVDVLLTVVVRTPMQIYCMVFEGSAAHPLTVEK
jgi:hypothetical protein